MSIVMFINLKGGVAKTTNAVAVAECLATNGHRTLLIDADHQCTASELLLGEDRLLRCDQRRRTLHDLLAAMIDDDFRVEQFESFLAGCASNITGGLPSLSVLACSVRIDDFSTNMAKGRRGYYSVDEWLRMLDRRRQQLRRWIQDKFDYAIIDCPPSIAMQVRFLLPVADSYVVPCIPDLLSVRGSQFLADRIRSFGYKIPPLGTLWSLYRDQNKLHHQIIEAVNKGDDRLKSIAKPFKTIIPNAAAITHATEPGTAPHSFRAKYSTQFAGLFEKVCEEIVQRSGKLQAVESVQVSA
ncbi:MAG TPA: AAA family ATPase [Blastocatellia bacterium]|nr:AAA family ATPase [Blastocatellia bacterium]